MIAVAQPLPNKFLPFTIPISTTVTTGTVVGD